ncbi:hypothetical protein ACQP0C_08085 [Nocardia sp. CA-129566]|uniref:hypothetical protein n=1 Tax=Nocardia sp. CA-129566 TaxID=3239976 RepID=UPI003D98F7CC
MSAYHQIFIRTTKAEGEIVDDITSASGAPLDRLAEKQNDISFGGKAGGTIVEVEMSHDFEDEQDLQFESYPILVTIRNIDSNKISEESAARSIFEALQHIGGYHMILVFNLQRLLARV